MQRFLPGIIKNIIFSSLFFSVITLTFNYIISLVGYFNNQVFAQVQFCGGSALPIPCGGYGTCDGSSGTNGTLYCLQNYNNPATECKQCGSGQFPTFDCSYICAPTPTPTPASCNALTTCNDCLNNSGLLACGWNGSSCQSGTSGTCPVNPFGSPYSSWYWYNCSINQCTAPTPTPTPTPKN